MGSSTTRWYEPGIPGWPSTEQGCRRARTALKIPPQSSTQEWGLRSPACPAQALPILRPLPSPLLASPNPTLCLYPSLS